MWSASRSPLPPRIVPFVLLAVAFAGLPLLATPALGAWSSDPAVNMAIADGAGEQVVPKIAGLPAGLCYVGWYDNRSGNYDVRLQLLDALGNEVWPHNGILVSGHAQDTWVTDWDLICDADGNCVLTFSDIRSGNLDVQAYKITPDGSFAWGPDGINLSQDPAFEPTPTVCQASDGDYVFAWGRSPDAGGGSIQVQRVAPDGTLRYPVGGIFAVLSATEEPAFPDLEPSLGGDVLLMWIRDISAYMSPRHIRLQRLTPSGLSVWATFTPIFDGGAVPLGYAPHIRTDAVGGAVCGWHRASGSMFGSFVQRVNADGLELFAHNGLAVTTDATRNHIDPATAYSPSTGEIFVFWNERNSAQSQWGIYGQRVSAGGVRQWGNTGLVLQPVNTVYKSYPRTVPLEDGAVCFFTDTPAGFSGDRLIAYRLNAAGANVWPAVPLLVSTPQSGKSRLPLYIDDRGTSRIIWEDTRNGTPDVYGQSVNADGTLGPNPGSAPETAAPRSLAANHPNPFRGTTELVLAGGADPPRAVVIVGPDGRLVRQVVLDYARGDRYAWVWDGCDAAGRGVPAGVYTYRWLRPGIETASGKAVLTR